MPQLYRSGGVDLSIEIFPPKSEDADASLRQTLQTLNVWQPAFISCTYGAGGTTSKRTLAWCDFIQNRLKRPATAHFTCVGSTREQLLEWLGQAWEQGVCNIMALRGDPPQGSTTFQPVEGGLRYANELVCLIKEHFPGFGVGVAAYPEKHPEACDAPTDLDNLKRKVDCGADALFTQLFYDNDNFYRFRDSVRTAGIEKPLIPGIMPITEFARIKRITALCGAVFPRDLHDRLEAVQDDSQAQFDIGVDYAIRQCADLIEQGVPGIHFYVLNRSQACEKILESLGMASA